MKVLLSTRFTYHAKREHCSIAFLNDVCVNGAAGFEDFVTFGCSKRVAKRHLLSDTDTDIARFNLDLVTFNTPFPINPDLYLHQHVRVQRSSEGQVGLQTLGTVHRMGVRLGTPLVL